MEIWATIIILITYTVRPIENMVKQPRDINYANDMIGDYGWFKFRTSVVL